jgi:hypothetical protein
MKTYIVVTNDEYELPVSEEIVGASATAEFLGIKKQRLRRCLAEGFPKKAKYKAVVVKERQVEDVEQHQKEYAKRYSLTHDRTEYFRTWHLRKKAGAVC